MIKTLIAVSMATLSGFNYLRPQEEAEYYLNKQIYIGQTAQDILTKSNFRYQWTDNWQYYFQSSVWNVNEEDEFTLTQGYNEQEQLPTNQMNDVALLLAPCNNYLYNQVIIISPTSIYVDNVYTSGNYTHYRLNYNIYENNELRTYSYTTEQYNLEGIIYNTKNLYSETLYYIEGLEEDHRFSIIQQQGGATYNFKIETITLYGAIAPFIQITGSYSDIVKTQGLIIPTSGTEYIFSVEDILTKPFINNGSFYDNLRTYGKQYEYEPQSGNNEYITYYTYAMAENVHYPSGNHLFTKVNQIQFDNKKEQTSEEQLGYWRDNRTNTAWLYNGATTYTLLRSDEIDLINGKNQTQKQCLVAHMQLGSTATITANTGITDIFELFASAFAGFGSFFSILVLPNITIGALISIPLLVGLIIWLINMFKRH